MACQSGSVEALLMAVYIVTGKLGNGKTLVTVGRIKEALERGCRVATNLDLNLVSMLGRNAKTGELIRIPDKPMVEDLEAIGQGYKGPYDESKFGLLVLDECGTWFNSRNWQDKTRKPVNDWFLHARKLRWHVYLIIQDVSLLDSQARDALAEFIVYCRRLDNIRLPFIGAPLQFLTGGRVSLPRIHRAKVVYGSDDLIHDVWTYRGNHLFSCYKTDQLFLADYPHAPHCLLSPWHTRGRHSVPMTGENIMRITKIYWRRFKSPVALATGLLLGAFAAFMKFASLPQSVAASSPAAVVPQNIQPDQPPPIITALGKLRITGVYSINGELRYQFNRTDDSEENHGAYLTDVDLSRAGVTLMPRSECRVDAFYSDAKITISCL